MRKRPDKEQLIENFIKKAPQDANIQQDIKDLHTYIQHAKWPLCNNKITPSLAKGSNLRKPLLLPLKEYEWNSINRHVKALGVQKSEWIRYAIFKLMSEEQAHFVKQKNERQHQRTSQ